MYVDSVRINICTSVPCMYMAMAMVRISTGMVCTKIASKSTPQGLGVDCCMSRDLRF